MPITTSGNEGGRRTTNQLRRAAGGGKVKEIPKLIKYRHVNADVCLVHTHVFSNSTVHETSHTYRNGCLVYSTILGKVPLLQLREELGRLQ